MNKFHRACIQNNIELIKSLLNNNNNIIYSSNDDGNTCGHLCVLYENYNLLFNLVKKYPKLLTYSNNNGETIPIILVNNLKKLHKLLDIFPKKYINELSNIDYNNKTIIHRLIDKYNDNNKLCTIILEKLFNMKVNINIPDNNSPLIYACINYPNIQLIKLLLNYNANPNLQNSYGITPLLTILNNKNIDHKNINKITKLLLDADSDINYSGPDDKYLPLNIALKKQKYDIVRLLFKYNPDFTYCDNNLNTPIHNALFINNKHKSKLNIPNDIMSKLIKNSNLNIPNINGTTPLHLLMKMNETNILNFKDDLNKKIINNELDFFVQDNNNNTPLSYITSNKLINFINSISNNILKSLIKKKCHYNDLNYVNIQKCKTIIKSHILNPTEEHIQNIKLPLTKNVNHGIFNADLLHNIIYLLQLMKKYDNIFIPFQYFIKDKYKNNILTVNNMNFYRTNEGNIIWNILSVYSDIFFEFMPYLIIWYDKNLYHYNKNLKFYMQKVINSPKIRFIILKLSLVQNSNVTHANIIIYDKTNNTVERFDPFGTANVSSNKINDLDNFIERILKKAINNKIIYKSPKDYMNKAKFQLISNEYGTNNRKLGDPVGYCLAWTYWFLELKLENPNKDIKKLVEYTLNNIIMNNNNKNSNQNNLVISYIRNYSKKLDDLKNKFLKDAGIPKSNFYNVSYDNNTLNKITKHINKSFNKLISTRL